MCAHTRIYHHPANSANARDTLLPFQILANAHCCELVQSIVQHSLLHLRLPSSYGRSKRDNGDGRPRISAQPLTQGISATMGSTNVTSCHFTSMSAQTLLSHPLGSELPYVGYFLRTHSTILMHERCWNWENANEWWRDFWSTRLQELVGNSSFSFLAHWRWWDAYFP